MGVRSAKVIKKSACKIRIILQFRRGKKRNVRVARKRTNRERLGKVRSWIKKRK